MQSKLKGKGKKKICRNIDEHDTEAANEENNNNDSEPTEKRRKRCNKETRKIREERKLNRNTGKAYRTRKNKIIPERKMKELKNCRNKCIKTFNDNVRRALFNEFWLMGNYNRRTQYISDLIIFKEKKVVRVRKPESNKNRLGTAVYHFRINGSLMRTCKDCFRRTFDIGNKFIEIILKKQSAGISGIMELDKRGSHVPKNKIREEEKQAAKEHILSIPSYESHYTRRQSSKKYLPQHYTLTSLYQAYKEKNPTNFINRRAYEEIFHSLNIKIKQPKKDMWHL